MNNFLLRTITSILFVVVMVACVLFHPAAFGALFLLIMLISMKEFYGISMGGKYQLSCRLAMLTAFVLYCAVTLYAGFGIEARFIALAIIPLMATLISPIFMKNRPEFGNFAYILTGLLYVALPVSLSPMIVYRGGDFDGHLLLSFFIMIWCSDSGAYIFGTLFGQKPDSRKLAPGISPKKSWWGFWGGIAVSVIAAVVLKLVGWMSFDYIHVVAVGILISCAGVCGDLVESLWKRHFGVKDSGNVIPGHGGMLDRFDSSLIAIPLVSAYLAALNLL